MAKDECIAYAREQYGAEPEYLWDSAPDAFVLRHRGNRKWYAVVTDARRDRLGLYGEGVADKAMAIIRTIHRLGKS